MLDTHDYLTKVRFLTQFKCVAQLPLQPNILLVNTQTGSSGQEAPERAGAPGCPLAHA